VFATQRNKCKFSLSNTSLVLYGLVSLLNILPSTEREENAIHDITEVTLSYECLSEHCLNTFSHQISHFWESKYNGGTGVNLMKLLVDLTYSQAYVVIAICAQIKEHMLV